MRISDKKRAAIANATGHQKAVAKKYRVSVDTVRRLRTEALEYRQQRSIVRRLCVEVDALVENMRQIPVSPNGMALLNACLHTKAMAKMMGLDA